MGQFKEHPYANTNWRYGGPLVRKLEPYLPPARNDYVHGGLVSDGGLLGSAFGGAAGARLGAQAGGVAGLPGGLLGAGAGTILGGALGYFGGAHAGHLGVRGAEVIGGILNNPSSYDVDQLGNPIGPSALQGQSATDSKEPAGSVWKDGAPAINSFGQGPVLRLVPRPQGDLASTTSPRSPVDQAAASGATPAPPEDTNELLKLQSIIQAMGSRGLFPIQ